MASKHVQLTSNLVNADINKLDRLLLNSGYTKLHGDYFDFKSLRTLSQKLGLDVVDGISVICHGSQKVGASLFSIHIKETLRHKKVVTLYNNKIYKIIDVDCTKNPSSEFTKKDGRVVTFKDYLLTKYNKKLSDRSTCQPLLLVEKYGSPSSTTNPIYLIPEFCFLLGLMDRQYLSTRSSASQEFESIKKFHKCILELLDRPDNSKLTDEERDWSTELGQLITVPSYLLDVERLTNMKKDCRLNIDKCMSPRAITPRKPTNGILTIVTYKEMDTLLKNFIKFDLLKMLEHLGFTYKCTYLEVENFRSIGSLDSTIRTPLDVDQCSLVLVVVPSDKKERYDSIKKLLTVVKGVPSQVVKIQSLKNFVPNSESSKGLLERIAIQIAAKTGAEPWFLKNLPRHMMVCSFALHCDRSRLPYKFSIAFCSSLNPNMSKWYSDAEVNFDAHALSSLVANFVSSAIKNYRHENSSFPQKIVLYHVENNRAKDVLKHYNPDKLFEILKPTLEKWRADLRILLSIVHVDRYNSTRFFKCVPQVDADIRVENSVVGTVVDFAEISKGFLLTCTQSDRQFISPTLYKIALDEINYGVKEHQVLALKLCHIYFNGDSIDVPAPCQYATKLVRLVGEHLKQAPHARLRNKLHFL